MTPFPAFDEVALTLLLLLLGFAVGQAWGHRRARAEAIRRIEAETERIAQEGAAWHERVRWGQRGRPEDATQKERA